MKADKNHLPGLEFDRYGRKLFFRLFAKGKIPFRLLITPVSIVRYFEFEYCRENFNENESETKVLDISSPYLFGFYAVENFNVDYDYINPDKKDLNQVIQYSEKINITKKFGAATADATKLKYEDESFDTIISISVIEHINGDGDSKAIREMWRVLKPGGKLILTFPVKKNFEIEYRDEDIYNLNNDKRDDEFFFQRIYNELEIDNRLLSNISNFEIVNSKIFGETSESFYKNYSERWKSKGYSETVKDAYHISKNFKYFNSISDLPGMGVMGITIRKSL